MNLTAESSASGNTQADTKDSDTEDINYILKAALKIIQLFREK